MNKIRLDIIGLSYSQTQTGAYALVLGEAEGNRRLPIIIGGFEAQAIAIELEKMSPSRPLTHDLFRHLAESFHIDVKEVFIYKLEDGIFYAKLVCDNGKETVDIDSRTSDAIALAVRFHCPIYTSESILDSAGIAIDEEPVSEDNTNDTNDVSETVAAGKKESLSSSNLSEIPSDELESMLQQAIDDEAYEKASMIRDELKRRNG
jgi:hypothetical protein